MIIKNDKILFNRIYIDYYFIIRMIYSLSPLSKCLLVPLFYIPALVMFVFFLHTLYLYEIYKNENEERDNIQKINE